MKVYTYPSKEIINKTSLLTMADLSDPKFTQIMDEMIYAARRLDGVGIAANQIGYPYQMFVAQTEENGDFEIYVNPKIKVMKGWRKTEEGCFSLPGFFEFVERADFIELEFYKLSDAIIPEKYVKEFQGQAAAVIQHEYDHLQGMTILNRVSPVVRTLMLNKIKKHKKSGLWKTYYETEGNK